MSRATTTSVDAGRMSWNSSPWTAMTAAASAGSTMNIRVRTTSSSAKPASASAPSMIANTARAWPAASPGWRETPSGPASVVPLTKHASPTASARE